MTLKITKLFYMFSEKFVKNEGRNWYWFLTTRHGCEDNPLWGYPRFSKTQSQNEVNSLSAKKSCDKSIDAPCPST